MLLAFLESVKYVGHLLPISFLRIFVGYYYLNSSLRLLNQDFLVRPRLAEQISEWLPASQAPIWYKLFLSQTLVPYWQPVAFTFIGIQLVIAFSYILGYLVRPIALMASLLSLNLIFISPPHAEDLLKTFIAVHIIMAWVGAGRCLGVDYYFFKRRRGIWW